MRGKEGLKRRLLKLRKSRKLYFTNKKNGGFL
jgi:hypothetical protein